MATQCSDRYERTSVITGHYIQVYIWTPIIEKELFLEGQEDNEHDKHAVAVMKDVGHALVLFHRCRRTFSSAP